VWRLRASMRWLSTARRCQSPVGLIAEITALGFRESRPGPGPGVDARHQSRAAPSRNGALAEIAQQTKSRRRDELEQEGAPDAALAAMAVLGIRQSAATAVARSGRRSRHAATRITQRGRDHAQRHCYASRRVAAADVSARVLDGPPGGAQGLPPLPPFPTSKLRKPAALAARTIWRRSL
jgi:hypothetical protein